MWIHKAVNHSNPDERITVQQALRMATINGAYATFDDKDRGSQEEGKFADMVVLSENPYTVPAEAIKKIEVEQLILGGKPYESAKTSMLNCIWKGIISNAKY